MFPNEVSDSLQNKITTTTSEPKQYVSGEQSYKSLCTILVLYFFFVLELLFFLAITTLDIIALCLKPAKNGEVSPEFLAEMEKTKVLKLYLA